MAPIVSETEAAQVENASFHPRAEERISPAFGPRVRTCFMSNYVFVAAACRFEDRVSRNGIPTPRREVSPEEDGLTVSTSTRLSPLKLKFQTGRDVFPVSSSTNRLDHLSRAERLAKKETRFCPSSPRERLVERI